MTENTLRRPNLDVDVAGVDCLSAVLGESVGPPLFALSPVMASTVRTKVDPNASAS